MTQALFDEGGEPLSDIARDLAREVLVHGPIERATLAHLLRLSPASLTRLSKPYLDAGFFVEGADLPRVGSGRRARPLDVRPEALTFVGIKLTGDDLTGVLTDLRAGVLRSSRRSLSGRDVATVVEQTATLVRELAQDRSLAAVGVSLGGRVGERRVVRSAFYLDWADVPLADELERALGVPVRVENDVAALMAAEHWFGPARDTATFALVTIGAGVGYALVVRDEVVTGPDDGLGVVGHAPLDPQGPPCPLGHRGCATAMLTIGAICAQVGARLGREVAFEKVLEQRDEASRAVVAAAARALGRLLAWIATTTSATTIVVAGEAGGLYAAAAQEVQAACARDRHPDAAPVRVLLEPPDFVMWARGAAAVAIQDLVGGQAATL